MNVLDRLMQTAEGLHLSVQVPNLGIRGNDCVTQAIELIRDMLSFEPAERCRISTVCEKIEELQGILYPYIVIIRILEKRETDYANYR